MPDYLGALARKWAEDETVLKAELELLAKDINHIKDIVAMQQQHAKAAGLVDTVNLAELVEDAVRINSPALEARE